MTVRPEFLEEEGRKHAPGAGCGDRGLRDLSTAEIGLVYPDMRTVPAGQSAWMKYIPLKRASRLDAEFDEANSHSCMGKVVKISFRFIVSKTQAPILFGKSRCMTTSTN